MVFEYIANIRKSKLLCRIHICRKMPPKFTRQNAKAFISVWGKRDDRESFLNTVSDEWTNTPVLSIKGYLRPNYIHIS